MASSVKTQVTNAPDQVRSQERSNSGGIDEGSANRIRIAELFQPSIRPRVGEFWKLTPEERARLAEEIERRRRDPGGSGGTDGSE